MMPRSVRTAITTLVALVASAGMVGTALVVPADAAPKAPRRVVNKNFPDPGALKYGDRYFLYRTGEGFAVQSSDSPDRGFKGRGSAMKEKPVWMKKKKGSKSYKLEYWAPHVFSAGTESSPKFVMFFAGSSSKTTKCIGRAVATKAKGPFIPDKKALLCGAANSTLIDPAHYRQGKKDYLVYKQRTFRPGNDSYQIRAIRMNGKVTKVKDSSWQILDGGTRNVEAPSLIRHGKKIWMFISVNDYTTCKYRTQVSSARSIKGPFKRRGELLLAPAKSKKLCGPGGAEVIKDGAKTRIYFHGWQGRRLKKPNRKRTVWTAELTWPKNNGTPRLR